MHNSTLSLKKYAYVLQQSQAEVAAFHMQTHMAVTSEFLRSCVSVDKAVNGPQRLQQHE